MILPAWVEYQAALDLPGTPNRWPAGKPKSRLRNSAEYLRTTIRTRAIGL